MNITNSFSFIEWYRIIGVGTGSRPRSAVIDVTIIDATDATLSESGFLAYTPMHSICIVPETTSQQKF